MNRGKNKPLLCIPACHLLDRSTAQPSFRADLSDEPSFLRHRAPRNPGPYRLLSVYLALLCESFTLRLELEFYPTEVKNGKWNSLANNKIEEQNQTILAGQAGAGRLLLE